MRKPRLFTLCAIAAIVVLCAGARPTLSAQNRNITMADGLDLYERGDRSIIAAFKGIDHETRIGLALDLAKIGPKWAKAHGAQETPRRLLVMATMMLELNGTGWEYFPPTAYGGISLVEWACDRIRPPYGPKTPLPAERLWHQVVFSVQERNTSYMRIQEHLWHIARRYKVDSPGLLAEGWKRQAEWEAMAGEVRVGGSVFGGMDLASRAALLARHFTPSPVEGIMARQAGGLDSFDRPPQSLISERQRSDGPFARPPEPSFAGERKPSVWTQPDVMRDVWKKTLSAYTTAAQSPTRAVAAEAELRMGYLLFVASRTTEALPHFAEAQKLSEDPAQLYLIELFSGWNHDRGGRLAEAELAYRRAIGRRPAGRTAAMWLATLLQSQGKLGEAQEIMDRALAESSSSPDPWPLFAQGEFPDYNKRLEQLREALWAGARSH